MRRRVGAVAAVIGLVGAIVVAGAAVAAKTRPNHTTLVGAQIFSKGRSFEAVYKATSTLDGNGAGVQVGKTSGTSFPLSGSSVNTIYYADGVAKSKATFSLGKPNAKGLIAIVGSGRCIAGGTGVHRHERCRYTLKGTFDTKTTRTTVRITGLSTR